MAMPSATPIYMGPHHCFVYDLSCICSLLNSHGEISCQFSWLRPNPMTFTDLEIQVLSSHSHVVSSSVGNRKYSQPAPSSAVCKKNPGIIDEYQTRYTVQSHFTSHCLVWLFSHVAHSFISLIDCIFSSFMVQVMEGGLIKEFLWL